MNIYEKLKQIPLETLVKDNAEFSNCFGGSLDNAAGELRKFLVLLSQSNAMLAPSEVVDFIYHKLLDNDDLRNKVEVALGGQLEHDSTIVGERLKRMYEETLGLYKTVFGNFAPAGFNKVALSAACCGTGIKRF